MSLQDPESLRLWPHRQLAIAGASLLVAFASPVAAQTPPQTLPPTREEVTRPESQPPQDRRLRIDVEGGLERAPCALDKPEFGDIRFTLRGVEFDGLEGLEPDALESSFAPLVGAEQPISVVCAIRDRALAILRDGGFIASIEVPEQRMSDGVIRFKVLLARLTQVRVRGNAGGAEQIIAGYLNQLTRQPVFNRNDAERYLLLASDLPGYTVRLTLRPAGEKPGDVIGDVTVERMPAYADLTVQNGGSRALGRWGAIARAQLFGLTGRADRTIVSAFATSDLEEQRTIQLGHDLAIGGEGLRVGALFTHAWANPAIAGDSDLKARSLLATLYADYPIVRSLGLTFRGSIGFDLVNQDVDFNGRGISEDRLRTGFVRLAMDALGASGDRRLPGEPLWQFNGFIELRKGLDILRASHACGAIPSSCDGVPPSRPSAVSTAAIVRTFLNAEFHPAPMVTFSLAASGQYAWKPLGSFEEFSAGNYTVGRGYDPGALLGDRGWGTQAEIRLGSTVPASVRKPAVEGYVFFDHARVRALDGMAPVGPRHLYSTGAGVRVTYDRFVLDGSLAVPLTQLGEADEKPDPRLLVSVTTRLWPWRYR